MGSGTKFITKEGLVSSVVKKIYTNKNFEVSADKIQTAIRDVIETLWDRRPNILIITTSDINIGGSSPYITYDIADPTHSRKIFTIPSEIDMLVFENATPVDIHAIRITGTVYNGKKLKISGNVILKQAPSGMELNGRVGRYFYYHNSITPFNFSYSAPIVEAFTELIWWNGVWFCEWY